LIALQIQKEAEEAERKRIVEKWRLINIKKQQAKERAKQMWLEKCEK